MKNSQRQPEQISKTPLLLRLPRASDVSWRCVTGRAGGSYSFTQDNVLLIASLQDK